MMFADAKVVEPDRLGVGDARDKIAERGRSVDGEVGGFLAERGGKTIKADFDGPARRKLHGRESKRSRSENKESFSEQPMGRCGKIDTRLM